MLNERNSLTLSSSKWVLACVWGVGGLILFVLIQFLLQKHSVPKAEIENAVDWFYRNIVTILGLIVGVFIVNAKESKDDTTRMVHKKFFILTLILSSVYLITIFAYLVIPAVSHQNQIMEYLSMSELWVTPIHAMVVGTLGIFFIQNEESKISEPEQEFTKSIEGYWWEYIKFVENGEEEVELSFFSISRKGFDLAVCMSGRHYDSEGGFIGGWSNDMVELNIKNLQVNYHWIGVATSGAHDADGFGKLIFFHRQGNLMEGHGGFVDIKENDMASAKMKSVLLKRVTKLELEDGIIDEGQITNTFEYGDESKKAILVKAAIDSFEVKS